MTTDNVKTLPAVSNAEFLRALFPTPEAGESMWACFFAEPPTPTARWAGQAIAQPDHTPARPRSNSYFCVALLRPDGDGLIRRRLASFSRLAVVVLDDVAPPAGLGPTWVLETSRPEGGPKLQVGFRLAQPITDLATAQRLHNALAHAGHVAADPSGNNPVRYVRLPVGANTKYAPPHPHRLLAWNPGATVTLPELVAGLGLDMGPETAPGAAFSNRAHVRDLPAASNFFASVNRKAILALASWVPELFPEARPYQEGFRVSSRDLGRELEEDLSLLPIGITDFGQEAPKTAIDIVLEWGPAADAAGAALWLCQRLGVKPTALGWVDSHRPAPPPPGPAAPPASREDAPSPASSRGMAPDGLLFVDDRNNRCRLIESKAAVVVADALRDRLAWDPESAIWFDWAGTHWQPQRKSAVAEKLIADAVEIGTGDMGFRTNYLNGLSTLIVRRALLSPPSWPENAVPFTNGLLDLKTLKLTNASPRYAMNYCLPHAWDAGAECPRTRAWLATAVEHDQETVEFLRAWLAALVRGIELQAFLSLQGRGGTGKGTFQRLAEKIVGDRNMISTTLRDLENSRFETGNLYGMRLVQINEAGSHGGSVNILKAITGGDQLRNEKKNAQMEGSFRFKGLVIMASNESMKSTDATSGLERRRLTVRFPRSFTPEEKAEWFRQGGEEKVLHTEIPGLFRWLLAMPVEEIHHRINNPPHRVAADNLLGMKANNSVAHWIMERTIPVSNPDDKVGYIQIGLKKEKRDDGVVVVANTEKWAYANYLAFCYETGRPPVSLVSFASTAVDMGETLGAHVVKKNHPTTRGAALYGLRLREQMTLEQYQEYCKQEKLEYKPFSEMPFEKAHDWTRTPLPPGAS